MSFMSVFVALLLICTIDSGVHAVFTPADSAALKAAVGSCTFSGGCTGGCLGENGNGTCPTFAASNDATGNPYGVMGDWDMSKVTSLENSTFTPPFFLVSLFTVDSLHSPPYCFFLRFPDFPFVGLSTTHAPTSSYSVLCCCCIQRGHFKMEHGGGDEHGQRYVHPTSFFSVVPWFFHLNSVHSLPLLFFYVSRFYLFLDYVHHGTDILLQRSMLLLHSTRTFPSGTLRR